MENISRNFSALNLSPVSGGELRPQASSSSEVPVDQVANYAGSGIKTTDITHRSVRVQRDADSGFRTKGLALKSAVRSGNFELAETILNENMGFRNRKIQWSVHLYLDAYFGLINEAKLEAAKSEELSIDSNPVILAAYLGHAKTIRTILEKANDVSIKNILSGLHATPINPIIKDNHSLKVAFELLLAGVEGVNIDYVNAVEKEFGFNPKITAISLENLILRKIYSLFRVGDNCDQLPLPSQYRIALSDTDSDKFYR